MSNFEDKNLSTQYMTKRVEQCHLVNRPKSILMIKNFWVNSTTVQWAMGTQATETSSTKQHCVCQLCTPAPLTSNRLGCAFIDCNNNNVQTKTAY